MKFKFQSFVDISTSASSMQIIQWAVGGKNVLDRCRHLFGAYKYFKLGKISVKLVPASTLPVDPQGLSYDVDDPLTVDPRDQMNPGLVRITNGEDVFTDVSRIVSGHEDDVYNAMMLDPRWSKFMLQSGFRRSAVPLYWQVGQLSQDKYPGSTLNLALTGSAGLASGGTAVDRLTYNTVSNVVQHNPGLLASSPRGLFQVGHRGRLGYLPTDFYQMIPRADGQLADSYGVNNIPQVSVITCVLPKAYKTIYYYRCFITEEVYFAGLRSAPIIGEGNNQYCGIDQFLIGTPNAVDPRGVGFNPPTMYNNNGGDMP